MRSTRLRYYYSYFPDLQRVHSIKDSLSVAPALYFNRCVRFISCRGLNDSSTALVFPSGTYLLDGCTVAGEARGYGTDEYSNDDSFHETTSTSLHRHRRLMKLRNSNACTASLRCLKGRRRHRETFVGTMEAGKHRDSYPLFTLNAIYQHLDPARLKFSRRSLHRVFRWSMTLWRAEPWQNSQSLHTPEMSRGGSCICPWEFCNLATFSLAPPPFYYLFTAATRSNGPHIQYQARHIIKVQKHFSVSVQHRLSVSTLTYLVP